MQNGGNVVVCPGDRIGATAHHHQHDRFARCNELFEQGLLIAWQVERGTAGSFARHVPFFAHDRDDNVRRFRQRKRFGKTIGLAFVAELVARALRVLDRDTIFGVGLHTLEHGDRSGLAITGCRPAADHVGLAVPKRADHGDSLRIGGQREHIAIVLEQNHRLARYVARSFEKFRLVQRCFLPRLVGVAIGIFEQSEAIFHFEHAAHCAVDIRLAHAAFFDRFHHVFHEHGALHVHIDAGIERLFASLFEILGVTMRDHLVDGGVVGDDKAIEAPFIAQDVGKQEFAAAGWHAVVFVERRHEGGDPFIDCGLERREVDIAQRSFGDIDRVIVAACLGCPVSGKVFRGCQNRVDGPQIVALVAMHACLGDFAAKVDIFPGTFRNAAPAGIARYIDHGGESPVYPFG